MVFHGPTKGCVSCKKRRKKCDQTRPSCLRCIRANRNCGGYDEETRTAFRPYESTNPPSITPSLAPRRCMVPKRTPIPGTTIHLSDDPTDVPIAKAYEFALRAFFYDFCIPVTNEKLSRGYLSGLHPLACQLGLDSELARACQMVEYFTHGRSLNRPHMVERAEKLHHELLGSLARMVGDSKMAVSLEARYVALSLGLYEMAATTLGRRVHQAHAKGLAALLNTESSSLGLLRVGNKSKSKTNGIFSISALRDDDENLDGLLLEIHDLRRQYSITVYNGGYGFNLRDDVLALQRRLINWIKARPSGFKSVSVADIKQTCALSSVAVGRWPGRVDTYFDLYVAGVWNIIREAQLTILDMLVGLATNQQDSTTHIEMVSSIVDDIIASIPYLLADNLHEFIHDCDTTAEIKETGKFLGGLLLIQPLYTASRLPYLSVDVQGYLKRCLRWIGEEMGWGQATVLAEDWDIDGESLDSGRMIIWAGFLG